MNATRILRASIPAMLLLGVATLTPVASAGGHVFTQTVTDTQCATFQGRTTFCVTVQTDSHFNCRQTGPTSLHCDGWVYMQGLAWSPMGLAGTLTWVRGVQSDWCSDRPSNPAMCDRGSAHVVDRPSTTTTHSFGPTPGTSSFPFSQFTVVPGRVDTTATQVLDQLSFWIHATNVAYVGETLTGSFGTAAIGNDNGVALAWTQ